MTQNVHYLNQLNLDRSNTKIMTPKYPAKLIHNAALFLCFSLKIEPKNNELPGPMGYFYAEDNLSAIKIWVSIFLLKEVKNYKFSELEMLDDFISFLQQQGVLT